MNLGQFAAGFQPPGKATTADEREAGAAEPHVLLAATVLNATPERCLVGINGVEYELSGSDVIDIQVLSPAAPEEPGAPTDAEREVKEETEVKKEARKEVRKEEVRKEEVRKEGEEPKGEGEPARFCLIKVKPTAVLQCRVQVPAILVAAAGTWVSLVPAPNKAA